MTNHYWDAIGSAWRRGAYCALLAVSLLGIGSVSQAAIITLNLQQGAAPHIGMTNYSEAEDTQLHDQNTQRGFQYGGSSTLLVRDRNSDDDALLRFGTGQIASAWSVNSLSAVSLRLTSSSVGVNASWDNEFSLYLLGAMPADAAWIEGIGTGSNSGGGSSYFWRNPGIDRWASGSFFPTIGTQISSGVTAVNTVAGGTTDFVLNATGISAVQGWLDGSVVNGGLLVVGRGNSNPGGSPGDTFFYSFHSKESLTPAFRPELIVTGDFTPIPEPSTLWLAVVALIGGGFYAKKKRLS